MSERSSSLPQPVELPVSERVSALPLRTQLVRFVLTGGLSAAPWARALDGVDHIDPDLTLKGLAILHAEVAGGEPLELGLA